MTAVHILRAFRGRLARRIALAVTAVCLLAAVPASANTDGYGNSVAFNFPCNPSSVTLDTPYSTYKPVLFTNGLAIVSYFGIPFYFQPVTLFNYAPGKFGYQWSLPAPSTVPRGDYSWNVLLQGNGQVNFFYYFLFSFVSDTALFNPNLNVGCSGPGPASDVSHSPFLSAGTARSVTVGRSTVKLSAAQKASNLRWLRSHTGVWSRNATHVAKYPRARISGNRVLIQAAPHAKWTVLHRKF